MHFFISSMCFSYGVDLNARRSMSWIILLLALLGISIHGHAQEAKEPTKLSLTIEATSGVNPDISLRASPIKVRIYELKDNAAFVEADYFSLDNTDKTTLGADLLAKEEFILRPGEKKIIERKSNPQTTAIGVLAGYRDLSNATWRVVQVLKPAPEVSWYRFAIPANKLEILIQLQPQGIVLIDTP